MNAKERVETSKELTNNSTTNMKVSFFCFIFSNTIAFKTSKVLSEEESKDYLMSCKEDLKTAFLSLGFPEASFKVEFENDVDKIINKITANKE